MALGLIKIFCSHVVIFVHLLHMTSVSKYLCDTVLSTINLHIFSVIFHYDIKCFCLYVFDKVSHSKGLICHPALNHCSVMHFNSWLVTSKVTWTAVTCLPHHGRVSPCFFSQHHVRNDFSPLVRSTQVLRSSVNQS